MCISSQVGVRGADEIDFGTFYSIMTRPASVEEEVLNIFRILDRSKHTANRTNIMHIQWLKFMYVAVFYVYEHQS